MQRQMMRSRRFQVLLLAAGMGLTACSKTPPSALRELVPSLSEEMVRHLSQDSPAVFREFARVTGADSMSTVYASVLVAPRTDSLTVFEQDETRLAPYLRKLEDTMAEKFKTRPLPGYQAAYHRAPVGDRREIIRITRELRVLAFDTRMSLQEKADAYARMIERCRPYASAINTANLYGTYASYLPRLGRLEEMPKYLELGVAAAIQAGDLETASQTLGTLGTYYSQDGDYDNMRRAWNQGLRLAREAQSWQEARILSFFSFFYGTHGRLALSRELLRRAQDRCRELGAVQVEIRFLMNEISSNSDLECWPLVGQGLERADELLRQGTKGQWSIDDTHHWVNHVHKFRAMYLGGTGSCVAAEKLASEVLVELPKLRMTPATVAARMQLAQALRRCDRLDEARRVLDEGERLATENGMPEVLEMLEVEKAEVCLALGDVMACRRALQASRKALHGGSKTQISREEIRRDVLSIRLALKNGKEDSARSLLINGLAKLKQQRARLDLSPDAAMALPAAAQLGDLAHELLDASPEDGYAREMEWRREEASLDSLRAGSMQHVRWTRDALRRLSDRHAAHCLYRVEKDRVVRWTAYRGRIVREILPLQFEELAGRIQSLSDAFRGGKAESPLASHELAMRLLPAFAMEENGPALLLITRDGPLDQLPFEVLNVSATGYTPLSSRTDVAYVLFDHPEASSASGPAVIVADPAYPPDLVRHYSILTEALPLGAKEANTFGNLFQRSVSLSGTAATKRNLLQAWTRAQALYFACHLIRDPEIPYIMFLPLARDSSDLDEAIYLDIADVRAADLSRCRLVVLSSCGSGAAYTTGRISVPSLAEGFVQAGAGAVVHTSWAVEDKDAARVMQAFETIYAKSRDPVTALSQARRQLMGEGAPPQVWAAYSITLGSL